MGGGRIQMGGALGCEVRPNERAVGVWGGCRALGVRLGQRNGRASYSNGWWPLWGSGAYHPNDKTLA